MDIPSRAALEVDVVGEATFTSPLVGEDRRFVDGSRRILVCSETDLLDVDSCTPDSIPAFELAGPREKIFFNPEQLACGIVTCGGLCPGLNDVIRSLTLTLSHSYGVKRVLGFRYGYAGLTKDPEFGPMELTPDLVKDIHEQSGTMLGSSRGPQDVGEMIATLQNHGVGILFTIGGDGTLRGAESIAQELKKRNIPIAVIGIPKTIDNDLSWTAQSFGFSTAVDEAKRSLVAAHAEARSAYNGIGLVKLMGRHSGFIAANAALAVGNVNLCLIPEVPFALRGENGFLPVLERRLDQKRHAVIVVAEGAGQELAMQDVDKQFDASGNVKLVDIGLFLKNEIKQYFQEKAKPITVKYIDPSYIIRSLPANATDSEFCMMLGQHAVHAAMAGRTSMVVGVWNRHFVNVPIVEAIRKRKQVDPNDTIWRAVLEATHQPVRMF